MRRTPSCLNGVGVTTRRCELGVAGRVADAVVDLIRGRFGDVTTRPADFGTTVIVVGLDPAAERALLTLLWDTGHDVIRMHSTGVR